MSILSGFCHLTPFPSYLREYLVLWEMFIECTFVKSKLVNWTRPFLYFSNKCRNISQSKSMRTSWNFYVACLITLNKEFVLSSTNRRICSLMRLRGANPAGYRTFLFLICLKCSIFLKMHKEWRSWKSVCALRIFFNNLYLDDEINAMSLGSALRVNTVLSSKFSDLCA